MRKIFAIVAMLFVLALLITVQSRESAARSEPVTPLMSPVDPAVALPRIDFGTEHSWDLPSCWTIQGTSCSTPGAWIRCQWQPGEPEVCVCQQNHTWQCG